MTAHLYADGGDPAKLMVWGRNMNSRGTSEAELRLTGKTGSSGT